MTAACRGFGTTQGNLGGDGYYMRRGRSFSLQTIRAIEDGTSDWRHYKAIQAIEEVLGLQHGELKVLRSYKPRGIRAAA